MRVDFYQLGPGGAEGALPLIARNTLLEASRQKLFSFLLLLALGLVAAVLVGLLVRRSRELRAVRELGERFVAVAQTGDLAERLSPHAGAGTASEIAESNFHAVTNNAIAAAKPVAKKR